MTGLVLSWSKRASSDYALNMLKEERADLIKRQLSATAIKTLGAAAAVGAGWRALLGLVGPLVTKEMSPEAAVLHTSLVPHTVQVEPLVDEKKKTKAQQKSAGVGDFFEGRSATDITSHPLGFPLLAGSILLGHYGGYRLVDWLLRKQRDREDAVEVEKAKEEYEKALRRSFSIGKQPRKDAEAASPLAEALDRFAAEMEKQAVFGLDPESLGRAVGLYLALAGAMAVPAATTMYDYVRKRQPEYLLSKAIKHQRAALAQERPPSVVVDVLGEDAKEPEKKGQ